MKLTGSGQSGRPSHSRARSVGSAILLLAVAGGAVWFVWLLGYRAHPLSLYTGEFGMLGSLVVGALVWLIVTDLFLVTRRFTRWRRVHPAMPIVAWLVVVMAVAAAAPVAADRREQRNLAGACRPEVTTALFELATASGSLVSEEQAARHGLTAGPYGNLYGECTVLVAAEDDAVMQAAQRLGWTVPPPMGRGYQVITPDHMTVLVSAIFEAGPDSPAIVELVAQP